MATTATSILEERLSEQIGDYIEVVLTTAIAASKVIISTNLNEYDSGRDDFFNDWFCYITDKANAAVQRQVSDYATATGQLTVRGANLTTDVANLATIRLHRYNRNLYINALNDAVREISGDLFQTLDFAELITGNILPNSHFRDWTAATAPDKYSMQDANITATALTTAGNYRGGAKSMNAVTGAGGAGKYVYISSNTHPRLLDLMGRTVSFYCWAKPEVADDAFIQIYTLQADGTAQTLTSTTANPAGYWTLLKLEDQLLNDDLVEIQFRFIVTTASKYIYYDNARAFGRNQLEYLLPIDLRDGTITKVQLQMSGYSDEYVDDLAPQDWETQYGWVITQDGSTDKYLRFPYLPLSNHLIRLIGYKPLSTLSAYTDTVEIGDEQVNLLVAYAKYKLYQSIEGPTSSMDKRRYETDSAKAYGEYLRLRPRLRLSKPKSSIRMSVY